MHNWHAYNIIAVIYANKYPVAQIIAVPFEITVGTSYVVLDIVTTGI